ncbi:sulfotransferase 1B1-like [Lutzomyia longipalpis]|uniref:sulfotransferase 1B1-like n=1 Tax=Lutzomyia longipalpis TaxID=7200 RepID=UPI0024839222|nr:sulfotransferase 1B1-like [Lutzomyia longipalpis]
MATFSEEISEEQCKKASRAGIKKFLRYGNFAPRPEFPLAEKWTKATYFLPATHSRYMEKIENFEVRPDDIWVVTYPKSGTTWTQEMVWQICNDLDFEKGQGIGLGERFPMLEMGTLIPEAFTTDTVADVAQRPSPRLIKSHLPPSLLPRSIWKVKPRIIYTARNAKDIFVSFYHHYRNFFQYKGSFDEFSEIFMNNLINYAPFYTHVFDYWNMRNEENILFLTFEEMKRDMPAVIEKTAEFLGKSLNKKQIQDLTEHLSFEKMSKNQSVDLILELKDVQKSLNIGKHDDNFRFIRKGQIGSYRDDMSPEFIEKFDNWLKEKLNDLQVEPELWKIFFLDDVPGEKSIRT